MKLLIVALIIFIVSQSIKLLDYLLRGEKFSGKLLSWVYLWTGEFPSTHSAVLAGLMYIIGKEEGLGLFFGFAAIVSGLFIYSLLEDKKRQELFEDYLKKSEDETLRKIVSDKKLLKFSGHTFIEIVGGIALGLLLAILIDKFI